MNWYSEKLEEKLNADPSLSNIFGNVYLPQQVAIPIGGKRPALYVMPDGEIRCECLVDNGTAEGYISSTDLGMSFKEHYSRGGLGVSARIPATGRYLRLESDEEGTYCCYSDVDPDDTDFARVRISDERYIAHELPRVAEDGTVYAALYREDGNHYVTAFASSKNNGEKWKIVELAPISDFPVTYPDKGRRYQANGIEPTVVCVDGVYRMLVGTSDDYLWQYTSEDGINWSEPAPTDLHSTYNGAFLMPLEDGRLFLGWNNSSPMPVEAFSEMKGCSELHVEGLEPTVFTNRDVCHAAVSEDGGKHWIGQREVFKPACRAYADYRDRTGCDNKGVHGFEALELINNKVLVHVGFDADTERLLLVDLRYLYEETPRVEDNMDGIPYLSTQMYLRDVVGKAGHYAYNRIAGVIPVQDPDTVMDEKVKREVFHVYRYHDERLVSEKMGMVQNFPAWEIGEITLEVKIDGSPLRVSLADHWINPTDPAVAMKSAFSFDLCALDAWRESGVWATYKIAYSIPEHKAVIIRVDMPEEDRFEDRFLHDAIFSVRQNPLCEVTQGLSYVHFQTMAEQEDMLGAYIGRIEYRKLEEFPYTDLD